MLFSTWLEKQPHGTLSRIHRESQLGWTTLWRASIGRAVTYPIAATISQHTGGVVSIEALCAPTAEKTQPRRAPRRPRPKSTPAEKRAAA